MDLEKVQTPEYENGGGLFGPDLGELEMSTLTCKVKKNHSKKSALFLKLFITFVV